MNLLTWMNSENAVSFQTILDHINALDSDDSVGICAHTRPDGDAIGSVLGLTMALRGAGINAIPLLADSAPAPKTYQGLSGFELFRTPDDAPNVQFDLLILLDTPTLGRFGKGSDYFSQSKVSLLVDHHPQFETFTDFSWTDTGYAATAHMVWELVQASRFDINKDVAIACLAGLFSDTGSFRYQKTDATVFRAAAEMVEAGANASDVSNMLYHSRSRGAVALEAIVMSRLIFVNQGRVAYSYITSADYETTGTMVEEGENFIDSIRSIDGVEVAFLITFGQSGPRVSLRSKTGFDVAKVANQFGGGGHRPAAGISWPDVDASLDDILSQLLPLLSIE